MQSSVSGRALKGTVVNWTYHLSLYRIQSFQGYRCELDIPFIHVHIQATELLRVPLRTGHVIYPYTGYRAFKGSVVNWTCHLSMSIYRLQSF